MHLLFHTLIAKTLRFTLENNNLTFLIRRRIRWVMAKGFWYVTTSTSRILHKKLLYYYVFVYILLIKFLFQSLFVAVKCNTHEM